MKREILDFDVIITTRNRPEKVRELVRMIDSACKLPASVIIVDSSDIKREMGDVNVTLKHLFTNRKNQPYQRFLGSMHSTSSYILFFDDDIEIVNGDYLTIFLQAFMEEPELAGVVCAMENKHDQTDLAELPGTKFKKGIFRNAFFRRMVANPILSSGEFWWCGVRGKMPAMNGYVEYVNGWAFCVNRKYLYRNFNFELFNLYDQGLGKGEDVVLGYTLSKSGKIKYLAHLLFVHNDQRNSVYTANEIQYAKRVAFSRLYLSLEYARLNKKSLGKAYFMFYWYSLNRTIGLLLNLVIAPSNRKRRNLLVGTWSGILKTFKYKPVYLSSMLETEGNGSDL